MFGVKVHEFMIGLPGPALRLHGKKTVYGITAIPLGGYVRIAGMEPGPENPLLGPALAAATRRGTIDADQLAQDLGVEIGLADDALLTLADWDALQPVEGEELVYRSRFVPDEADDPVTLLDRARKSTYRALPTWKRLVVLSAGVVMNLLTAVLVFTIVLSVFGYMKETGRLGEVNPGSGAAEAGIKAGDRLVSLGGSEIGGWQDVVLTIGRYQPGDEITVVVSRGGTTLTFEATLGKRPGSSQALLGVSPELVATTPNVLQAILLSFTYIGMTFEAIAGFFNPQTFQASVSGASSVIGASYFAAEAARAGALDYAGLVAVLSLSLGVINIFPIPPLDGGKIAVELFERLRGRPLSRRVSLSLSAAGAALLFALIAYLMYSDVVRYIVR
jgi:regulator of sigma E protease